jgi:hypothetical protein
MNGWRESMYLVTFGLCLVLAMATVLFGLVGLNPKNVDYGSMPWVYSGLSLVGAVTCWVVSGRLAKPSAGPNS